MHIVLVSHYSPPHPGGIQFVVGQLWERLAARGYRTTMIACDTGIPAGIHREGSKTRIGLPALNVLEKYSIPFPLFDPLALRRALTEVLRTADAVHVHGMLYMSSVLAARMAHRRGLPVVLTEHVGRIPFRNPLLDGAQRVAFDTIGRHCCRQCDVVTVLNGRVAGEVRRLAGSATPIVKIPNGVDSELFSPAEPSRRRALRQRFGFERFVALFVGRFVRKKGVALLLAAAAEDFELVLCGAEMEARRGENVRMLGPLDQRTLADVYRAADALVLPSEGEGFPLVVQEAMASGLPVIVSDNPENREYVDESVARFVEREPGAIREEIRSLARSQEIRERMGAAARAWAVEHFDWERTVDRYVGLYGRQGIPQVKCA